MDGIETEKNVKEQKNVGKLKKFLAQLSKKNS